MKNKLITAALIMLMLALFAVTASAEVETVAFEADALQSGIFRQPHSLYASESADFDEAKKAELSAAILASWDKYETEIPLTAFDIKLSETKTLFALLGELLNDNPEYFFVDSRKFSCSHNGSYVLSITTTYAYPSTDIPTMRAKLASEVETALAYVEDRPGDFDKLLGLHDYLVLSAEYDEQTYLDQNTNKREAFSSYGVLVDKLGVCQSYALAYKLLLNRLDIESELVVAASISHAWNLVKLGEAYYHVDVTWDDPLTDRPGVVGYTNFLCSDSASDNIHKTLARGSHAAASDKYDSAVFKSSGVTNLTYLDGKYYFIYYNAGGESLKYSLCSMTADATDQKSELRKLSDLVVRAYSSKGKVYSYLRIGMFNPITFRSNGNIYYSAGDRIYRYEPEKYVDTVVFLTELTTGHIMVDPLKTASETFTGTVYDYVYTYDRTVRRSVSRNVSVKSISGSLSHTFVKAEDLIPYTCEANGGCNYTCSHCEITVLSVITPAHHDFEEISNTDPTETEVGRIEYECKNCLEHKTDYLAPEAYLPGDADGNGEVNEADAMALASYIAGWKNRSIYEINCDFDANGVIDTADVLFLLRHFRGIPGYKSLPDTMLEVPFVG